MYPIRPSIGAQSIEKICNAQREDHYHDVLSACVCKKSIILYPPTIFPRSQDFVPNPPIPRVVAGHEPKQRPRNHKVEPQKEAQADNVYQTAHVGEIVAEMVRPNVSGPSWGGYDIEKLLAHDTGLWQICVYICIYIYIYIHTNILMHSMQVSTEKS